MGRMTDRGHDDPLACLSCRLLENEARLEGFVERLLQGADRARPDAPARLILGHHRPMAPMSC
jgi:hypothetical protein